MRKNEQACVQARRFGVVVDEPKEVLGPAFILTGIMLIVGLGTRLSLLAQGLLFIALTVGLVLIDANDGVAYLGIHIALVAGAFLLARHNRFVVLKKW